MVLGVFILTQVFSATGDSIIKTGDKYLGRPYSYRGSIGDLSKLDRLSFTARVFKENGITLTHVNSKVFL